MGISVSLYPAYTCGVSSTRLFAYFLTLSLPGPSSRVQPVGKHPQPGPSTHRRLWWIVPPGAGELHASEDQLRLARR